MKYDALVVFHVVKAVAAVVGWCLVVAVRRGDDFPLRSLDLGKWMLEKGLAFLLIDTLERVHLMTMSFDRCLYQMDVTLGAVCATRVRWVVFGSLWWNPLSLGGGWMEGWRFVAEVG